MTRLCSKSSQKTQSRFRYASSDDLHEAFVKYRAELEWLAFFLTGDESEARACIVDASSLAVGENQVFEEWLERWARRATITSAVEKQKQRILQLSSTYTRGRYDHEHYGKLSPETIVLLKEKSTEIISRLDVLDRFALILRGVEDYSPKECALILGISRVTLDSAYCSAQESLTLIDRESRVGPITSRTGIGFEPDAVEV